MFKHAPCDTHRYTGGWYRRCDIRLEYGRDDFNDQHEHGGELFRDCDGCQRMHWFRLWHVDGQSEPHSVG